MTEAEKKRMLQLVRIAEFLYSETVALKRVLLSHGIPEEEWEKQCLRLVNDPDVVSSRQKFQRLYDQIESAPDETATVQALLRALPISKKPLN